MKVAVTGSQGYIGRNLCPYLMDRGFEVTGFDIKDHPVRGGFSWLLPGAFDAIVHLAAWTSIEKETVFKELVRTNVFYLEKFMERLEEDWQGQFIFFSSGGVYQTEEIGAYVLSKQLGERIVLERGMHDVDARVVRPANVIGALSDRGFETTENGHLFPCLEHATMRKERFRVDGDGWHYRDFIHVRHICYLVYRILDKEVNRKVISAGSGGVYSVRQIVDLWRNMVDPQLEVEYGPKRSSNPKHIPMEDTLPYPEVAMGVMETLKSYKRRIDNARQSQAAD